MTILNMLIAALGQALSWWGSHRARQFIERCFRQAGYDDDALDNAREAVTLLVTALMSALMTQILRLLGRT
ncbi:hypothetical protein [Klebsiella aerogenes]|jgi:hypothetical protein|uniref:hypothetical protein n=1 Tax=Klebsiella aerogenes TaxID=548 RepID=UPI0015C7F5D7|nr:hypothetical protein [Klebsiella aerogenes]WHB04157.1 hypothetical protein HZS33_006725 [Klebsiella aerogenes]